MSIDVESWRTETEDAVRVAIEKVKFVLQQVDSNKIIVHDANDLYKVSNSLASLSKSIEVIERSSRDRNSLLRQVADEMKAEVRGLLASEPELIVQVLGVIDYAEDRLQIKP